MATMNPFDLLVDDDNDDPNQLLAAAQLKVVEKPKKAALPAQQQTQTQPAKSAKLPTKPPPPAQAVREAKYEGGRGASRGGGRGRERGGGGGFNRDMSNDETSFGSNNGFAGGYRPSEEGDAGKPSERRGYSGPRGGGGGGGGVSSGGGGGFRGSRRGGFSNGEDREGERPRRMFDRRSGTGRGSDIKREGSGRGNWGTPSDDIAPETEEPVAENEKNIVAEKQSGEEEVADANKENPSNEPEEKEPEDKEMTLEEYEKIREEKRKALMSTKAEERKIDVKKEFGAMQQLSNKKSNDEIFIKLGSEKDKRKDAADKDDKAKKSVSINEFLKPVDGERYYNPGGRGRGRGRGPRGGFGGGSGGGSTRDAVALKIEDPGHFPTLGGK
ncbi:RGG repeats nuclear RNA binding protein A-like [Euphorbia lathyris]|uniref:RGG repeats nuclear RNA binding protein A-like n=1 Tax=Euphorbia lathyris TaxID=212925 RepID=UPI0033135C42